MSNEGIAYERDHPIFFGEDVRSESPKTGSNEGEWKNSFVTTRGESLRLEVLLFWQFMPPSSVHTFLFGFAMTNNKTLSGFFLRP